MRSAASSRSRTAPYSRCVCCCCQHSADSKMMDTDCSQSRLRQARAGLGSTHRPGCPSSSLPSPSRPQAQAERCLALTVNEDGTIIQAGKSPRALFDLDSSQLTGRCISDLLDVFKPGRLRLEAATLTLLPVP